VSLMTMLATTEPYFIRCVKPNMSKVPDKFDQELIYNQLLYAGMLETIRIRRMGYPIRYTLEDFWKRYKCICPEVCRVTSGLVVGGWWLVVGD
jgi:myosin X